MLDGLFLTIMRSGILQKGKDPKRCKWKAILTETKWENRMGVFLEYEKRY